MTKRVTIKKSKLFFVIPKIISVIPYPYKGPIIIFQLSLIPKTPDRASSLTETVNHIKYYLEKAVIANHRVKTDSAQSSSNQCKNYILKIYSQNINVLNTI